MMPCVPCTVQSRWVPLARLCYDFALRGGVGHDPWASAPGGAELEIIRYLIDADKSAEVGGTQSSAADADA